MVSISSIGGRGGQAGNKGNPGKAGAKGKGGKGGVGGPGGGVVQAPGNPGGHCKQINAGPNKDKQCNYSNSMKTCPWCKVNYCDACMTTTGGKKASSGDNCPGCGM